MYLEAEPIVIMSFIALFTILLIISHFYIFSITEKMKKTEKASEYNGYMDKRENPDVASLIALIGLILCHFGFYDAKVFPGYFFLMPLGVTFILFGVKKFLLKQNKKGFVMTMLGIGASTLFFLLRFEIV